MENLSLRIVALSQALPPHTKVHGCFTRNLVFKHVRLYQLTRMQREKIKHGDIGWVMVMGFSVVAPGTLGFDNVKAHTKSYLTLIFHYAQEAALSTVALLIGYVGSGRDSSRCFSTSVLTH